MRACLLSLLLAVAWTRLHCWAHKNASARSRCACVPDQALQGTWPGVGVPVGLPNPTPHPSGGPGFPAPQSQGLPTSPSCLPLQRQLCPLDNSSACPAPPSRALCWAPSCPPSCPHSCFWCSPPVSLSLLISHWHSLSLWVSVSASPPLPLSAPISLSPASSVSTVSPQLLHSLTLPQLFTPLLICHCVPLQFPFSIACAFSLTRSLTHPLLHLLSSFSIF